MTEPTCYEETGEGVEFPDLHQAVMDNDVALVSSLLRQADSPSEQIQILNIKDVNGLTALQVASKMSDSPDVINTIAGILTEDTFISCLRQKSREGQTALHIAVMENNSASLHFLLRNVKDPTNRNDLIGLHNQSEECISQLAMRLQRPNIGRLLKYHQQILSREFEDFFTNLEHSLFGVKLTEKRWKSLHSKLDYRKTFKFVGEAGYDTFVCLQYGDMESAESLINKARKNGMDSIHTRCNNGFYMYKKDSSQVKEIEYEAFCVLDLVTEQSGKPQLQAKIDYAYWLAEAIRTEDARTKACDIFKECLKSKTDSELQDYCRYIYVKILVRLVRSDSQFEKNEEWVKKMMGEATDQLILLHGSKNVEYQADIWLWLAELQPTKLINKLYVKDNLNRFSRETEIFTTDPESCLNKAIEFKDRLKQDNKFKARIAKICLECAFLCKADAISDRKHWFGKALELSEECVEQNVTIFMCSSTSAKALIELWCIEMYTKYAEVVKGRFKMDNSRRLESVGVGVLWRYLFNSFYVKDIADYDCTKTYLGRALKHLTQLVEYLQGWKSHGIIYARVRYLLGHADSEVIDAFKKALENCENVHREGKVYENLGHYYLVKGKYDLAEENFKEAISKCTGYGYRPEMARRGLEAINKNRGHGPTM